MALVRLGLQRSHFCRELPSLLSTEHSLALRACSSAARKVIFFLNRWQSWKLSLWSVFWKLWKKYQIEILETILKIWTISLWIKVIIIVDGNSRENNYWCLFQHIGQMTCFLCTMYLNIVHTIKISSSTSRTACWCKRAVLAFLN